MKLCCALVVAGLGCQSAFAGPDAIEGFFDAGELITTALDTTVLFPGQPIGISGRLDGSNGIPPDFVDAFLITITTPGIFTAETFQPSPLPGRSFAASDFDTQLWLFDISGFGLLANDNKALGNVASLLTPPSTDGTGIVIPGPGTYMLVISVAGAFPISAGGAIFDLTDPPGITQVSGPDGIGGAGPLIAWDTSAVTGTIPGDYHIHITPSPGALPALLMLGFFRNRRR